MCRKWIIPLLFVASTASAQPAGQARSAGHAPGTIVPAPDTIAPATTLKEITVTHSAAPATAPFHTLSRIDADGQPIRSTQDLLRLVPGLFIAQHQGGGKAEQLFLRGFDADHGTDVNITTDGIPVNMVSQAHGQGYADMHFIIPETIDSYDFGKGPYYADKGDFTTAGYVSYDTKKALDSSQVKVEGGQFHTGRIVTLLNLLSSTARQKGQSAYLAAEGSYSDGPFHYPEHFNRGNLFGKLITPISRSGTATLILSTFASKWRAAGEIPERAVAEGYIKDRFGVLDSAQGGNTSRTNASLKVDTRLAGHLHLENQAWYSRCSFDLLSNFTYFYFYPTTGDEFRQHEKRDLWGYSGRLTAIHTPGNALLTSAAGWGLRYDRITPSFLAHTAGGDSILDYLQLGNIRETALNAWWSETLEKGRWLVNIGARLDYLHFVYNDRAAAKAILSPKLNIQYDAGNGTQIYLKLGKGFHSNDARVVIANKGYATLPEAYGADLGINWKPLKALFINAAAWYLYLRQEFTYGADLGDQAVVPGGRTRRQGIDLSARIQLTPWLLGNLNIDLARPRDIDAAKGQNFLPLAPTFSSTAALNFRLPSGFNGGISYRYLHDRPANEDNTLTAKGYFITDLSINYTQKRYEAGLSVENLFNRSWNEGQFAYTSRLRYEPAPVTGMSFTPGTPFFARLNLAVFF